MDEYIEKGALFDAVWDAYEKKRLTKEDVLRLIDEAPAADVVEVVRCEECANWGVGDCYRQELTLPNDFCSYGVRKEEEDVL